MAKADVDISVGINDKAVTAALNNLSRKLDQFGKQAERSTRQAAKGVASMTDALYLFERRIATVTRAFQLLGAGASLAVFKNFVDQAQSANNAIRSISETQDQFNALQKETLRVSNLTGEAFRATATGVVRVYRSIEDLGGSAKTALKVVETLNKTLVISGATGSEATSTLIQFTQALQSGVLQGDELRSLRENAPLAMLAIAKAAGVTTAELKKMGSEGKLTTEILVKAFTDKEFIKQLDEMRDRMDRTFSQSLTVAGNNFAIFFSKLEESTGILAKAGSAIVLLSNSLNQLAANKFLLAAGVSLGLVAKFGPALTALGSASLIASSSMTILALSVARATAAIKLFIITNAPLLAFSAVVIGIAAAFDLMSRRAKEAEDRIAGIREELALENMKFNDFLSKDQLNALTEAQAKLRINKERLDELNTSIERNTELLGKGREEGDIARTAAIRRATEERDALEKTNVVLQKVVVTWREYAEAVKRSNEARDIIRKGQSELEIAQERLAVAKQTELTGDREIAQMEVKLKMAEQELAAKARAGAEGTASYELLMRQLEPQREAIRLTKEAIALEAKKEKKPKIARVDDSAAKLLASYLADLAKARTEAEGVQKVIDAMQSGASEDALTALREEIDLQVRIIELRKQYAKLPGGTAELEAQLALNNKLNNSLRDNAAVYQLLLQSRQDVIDMTFEEYAATEELDALRKGASAAELEDLRASLAIREKYSKLGESEIERLIALDKERRTAIKTLEDTYAALERFNEIGKAVGQAIGDALGSIITGAQNAEEAIKSLIQQILIAIAQAAILNAFNGGGFGKNLGDLITGSVGRSSGPNVRIYNQGGGVVSTSRRSNGDTDIIIGQLAASISKGGNQFDSMLRRTYGLRRQGV